MKLWPALFAAILVFRTMPADAQQPPADGEEFLRGIREIAVFYDQDQLPDEATCGVDPPRVKTALQQVLLDAGVKVPRTGRDFTGPMAFLQVTSETISSADGACATAVHVELSALIRGSLMITTTRAENTTPVVGTLVLLADGGLHLGSRARHGQQVAEALIRYVKGIVTKVKIANQ